MEEVEAFALFIRLLDLRACRKWDTTVQGPPHVGIAQNESADSIPKWCILNDQIISI